LTIRGSGVVSRRLDPFQCQIVLGVTTPEDLVELFIEIGWSVLGLKQFPNLTDADIDANITNICAVCTENVVRIDLMTESHNHPGRWWRCYPFFA
jgi:hypothetical protein